MKVAVIGPLAKELIVHSTNTELEAGGGVFHIGTGLYKLNSEVKVFPSLSQEDVSLLGEFPKRLKKLPNFQDKTMLFSKEINKKNEIVSQKMRIVRNTYDITKLKTYNLLDFDLVLLTPLFNNNFSQEAILYLSTLGVKLAVDMNGFLRHHKDGKVGYLKKENGLELLKNVDYAFLREKEARFLTGQQDPKEQALDLMKTGVSHTIIKTEKPGCIILEKKLYKLEGHRSRSSINPHIGDFAFIAGFISEMERAEDNWEKIGTFANSASTVAIEEGTLKTISREKIETRLVY